MRPALVEPETPWNEVYHKKPFTGSEFDVRWGSFKTLNFKSILFVAIFNSKNWKQASTYRLNKYFVKHLNQN